MPLEAFLLDAPGYGQAVAQEPFGGPEQAEGIAVELPVVEKLRPVGALEPSDAKQALRKNLT